MSQQRSLLHVYYGKVPVGRIEPKQDGGLSFQYDPAWLEGKDSFPVSHRLPLQKEAFPPESSHAFFANLLPEGEYRKQLAGKLGISEVSDYQFIKEIGGECAGALQIYAEKNPPKTNKSGKTENTPVSKKNLSTMLRQKNVVSVYGRKDQPLRLSLAGAQNKLPVIYNKMNNRIYTASEEKPSTHILKIPNRDFKFLPENECYMNWTAKEFGLNVPEAHLYQITGESKENFLLVERYDRYLDHETVKRFHQEDFCQALGVFPDQKYEKEGGPSFSDAVNLIRNISSEAIHDVDQLLDWMIFNLLCRNADAHGKNISILYTENGQRLAPFYDLVCTAVYKKLDRNLAMSIGEKQDPGSIGKNDWKKFAEKTGVTAPFLLKKVSEKIQVIETAKDKSYERFTEKYGEYEFINQIRLQIHRQAKRTADLL